MAVTIQKEVPESIFRNIIAAAMSKDGMMARHSSVRRWLGVSLLALTTYSCGASSDAAKVAVDQTGSSGGARATGGSAAISTDNTCAPGSLNCVCLQGLCEANLVCTDNKCVSAAGAPSAGGASGMAGSAAGGAVAGSAATGGTLGTNSSSAAGGEVGSGGTLSTSGGSPTGGLPSTTGGASGASGGTTSDVPPSCQNLAVTCQGESCCTSIPVPGGSFRMGRSTNINDGDYCLVGTSTELPDHPATVSSFRLDKYEVTVSRFRQFVAAYDSWHVAQGMPLGGDGTNPSNLATGWQTSWSSSLPPDSATLVSNLKGASAPMWSDLPGAHESYPINFVTWYEAFAFCIWDGGRLPTEAEWEYTAAGGSLELLYPSSPPDDNCDYICDSCASQVLSPVGSAISRAGHWGHFDLAGNVWEFVYDYFAPYTSNACNDCATTTGGFRVARGGSVLSGGYNLRAAARRNYYFAAGARSFDLGFRCAR